MRLPADRENWTPLHAERALVERDKAFERCEEYDSKFGRDSPKTLDAWLQYFRAEDAARDVCRATSTRFLALNADEALDEDVHGKKPGALSDKTKGMIVGAAGALALAGIIYAIVKEEEKPKAHTTHKPAPTTLEDLPLDQDMFAEPAPGPTPGIEAAEVEVIETPTPEGGVKITEVMKDVSTVGMAVRGLSALEPVAEMLIALL